MDKKPCPKCNKILSLSLSEHIKTNNCETTKPENMCTLCNKKFVSPQSLNYHTTSKVCQKNTHVNLLCHT